MELVLAGESRPDTTDLNVKIIIKKKSQMVCPSARELCSDTAAEMADLPAFCSGAGSNTF